MNPILNPIKRCEQLAPLSCEHHYGLLFVWKLRQGIGNATPVETLRLFCNWFWKNHIKLHFHQEENILLPYLDPVDKFAIQLKKEHDDIRDLLIAIDNDPDNVVLDLLARFLEGHIRFEERILFPHLERKLSAEQLNIILQQLNQQTPSSIEWKDEFWTKKKCRKPPVFHNTPQ